MALLIIIGAGAFLCTGCLSCESYSRKGYDFYQVDKVAIVDVIGPVGGEGAKNQIADIFVMELLRKGYSPIERAQVQLLLKEQKFQASDVTSAENVARAGEILNVPVIMIVNIPKFNEDMTISAKLVDVEDGSILWMGSGTGTGGKTIATIAGAAAGAIVGGAVTGEDDKVVGAIAGGVLGGAAGNLLAPQKEQQARRVIKKICESLPARL
jgi:outer membrane lipoprotein SlyB